MSLSPGNTLVDDVALELRGNDSGMAKLVCETIGTHGAQLSAFIDRLRLPEDLTHPGKDVTNALSVFVGAKDVLPEASMLRARLDELVRLFSTRIHGIDPALYERPVSTRPHVTKVKLPLGQWKAMRVLPFTRDESQGSTGTDGTSEGQ
jgi:hypothetical protein